MPRKDQRNLALAIILFAFVNFSIPFAIGNKWLQAGRASSSWPVAIGEILNKSAGNDSGMNVTYKYQVDRQFYTNSRIRFGFLGDLQEELRSVTNGASVNISYHPRDPSTSVLLPGTSKGTGMMKSIGMLGMVLSAFAALGIWKYFRNRVN